MTAGLPSDFADVDARGYLADQSSLWVAQTLDRARGVLGVEQTTDLLLQLIFLRSALDERADGMQWLRLLEALKTASPQHALSEALDGFAPGLGAAVPSLDYMTGEVLPVLVEALEGRLFGAARGDGKLLQALCHHCFEAVLRERESRLARLGGEISTPAPVARLMARLLELSDITDSVHDPACGTGTALLAAGQRGARRLSGTEKNHATAAVARMRLQLSGLDADIRVADSLLEPDLAAFNGVLLQPPFGQRLDERDLDLLKDQPPHQGAALPRIGDLVWLQLARGLMRPGGRAVVLLPEGALFRTGREEQVRRRLLEADEVEAVIGLPANALRHTSIASCLVVLRAGDRPAAAASALLAQVNPGGRGAVNDGELERIAIAIDTHRHGQAVEESSWVAQEIPTSALLAERSLLPRRFLAAPPAANISRPRPPQTLLTEVRVTNLKSFGPTQRVEFARINLIYGQNSAGKSSLLQSLLLLKQSLSSQTLITEGPATDAGSFRTALHRQDPYASVSLGLSFGARQDWDIPGGTPNPALIRSTDFSFKADRGGAPQPTAVRLGFGETSAEFLPSSSHPGQFELPLADARALFLRIAEGSALWPFDSRTEEASDQEDAERRLKSRLSNARSAHRHLKELDDRTVAFSGPGLLPRTPSEAVLAHLPSDVRALSVARSYLQRAAQLTSAVGSELELLLGELVHLGPLRPAPRRFYNRASGASRDAAAAEQTALHLFDNASDLKEVNRWLDQLGLPYSLAVVPVSTPGRASVVGDLVALVLTHKATGVQLSPVDVGFGVSQMLPIVVELLSRQEAVICIEQPETHLHPKLQTELGDLLIHSALTPGRENQLLVETHSEHLLLRLQRRIREGSLTPEDVAVIYVDQDADGAADVQRLRLDEQGVFIDAWPGGFFDEELDELFGGL